MLSKLMAFLLTNKRIIVCNLYPFYEDWNLGIDFMWVNRVIIYLDISWLANPKLIIFCKKGKKISEVVKEAVYEICRKSPKTTSYGNTGRWSF